ncbi:hypothetical protein [Novosphingobium sp. TCA1]|uniref:hypothetical protein n=1 Tax=Novosphingobium sp. TCA1 TaxID=2682474 RepID=UPI00130CAEBD|nr:hypothetical protein [Novosphingobium sp. TCA1]GFE72422.1 hypothetical protein NTCA1_00710 [Novosphingobium sp. TCA1]
MQDQHFMQQWNAGHDRFSEELDRGLAKRARKIAARLRRRAPQQPRSEQCGPERCGPETQLARKARLTSLGVIGGVLAGASLGMVAPLVLAIDCPQTPFEAARLCTRAALT